ncbi:ATP-binding cassette domain-containing protein [Brevibacterium sp. 5221]|uniref:ATP-binding cassette domain-containing protein n=1 Tax=Brevibacterium rongguiense TaxID=2695267 RepID=A0A6N9HA62_9MICO|nr:ATP-binding cassette domain-containing protein [Brevibacterium rongguiense]MYM20909.1 ATP-binding cassette domain-containing protein [Brevibacterium rongguiense]
MATVALTGVTHRYPSTTGPSLLDVTLRVADGEFLVVLGGPGSGRSTLLRMIQGMEKPTTGTITIDQRDVAQLTPGERNVTMAFENYALYPHMSVAENMGFALRLAGRGPAEVDERVAAAAGRLGLAGQLTASPDELTGAQRQTVALGRALVRDPAVFLMDEPLVKMPPEVRASTRDQVRALQRELGITTIYATADVADALAVADRIAVLEDGRITHMCPPDALPARWQESAAG